MDKAPGAIWGGIAIVNQGYALWIHEAVTAPESKDKGLIDYKFYCFNGDPRFLYVSEGLEDHSTANISFVSLDWEKLPFYREDYKPFDTLPNRPKHFDKMIDISRKLSNGIKFVRVDLYELNDRIYFSELTFHPCSGFMPFNDSKYDDEIGRLLKI